MTEPSDAAIEEALRRAGWSDRADIVAWVRKASNEIGNRSILAHAKTLQEVDRVARSIDAKNEDHWAVCEIRQLSHSLMLPDQPDPDEELAREVAVEYTNGGASGTVLDISTAAALATIKRLREQGRLTDAK